MQLKWLEDFVALAQSRSFSRAAELRHVTHPAFGRRIKALELWAGAPLIERGSVPLTLTAAGVSLLDNAEQILGNLGHAREALQEAAGRQASTVTLATGRTLARTLLAELMPRLKPLLAQGELRIVTRSQTETAQMLERGEAEFMITYHHPLLALRLNAKQYAHLTLALDKLVPVSRANAQGRGLHSLAGKTATPYLAYDGSMALGRLVQDHLANNPHAPRLQRVIECDSADTVHEYALKGLGVAWLPWSMVAGACKAGQLVLLGDAQLEVRYEVRAYRAKHRMNALAERMWQALAPR
ncbi:DNA-binding transcriptional regulator, LysR family [Polaromonas sp. OV174]|uniref:LysR family transcriptional regulator n=1 Tax=Polaromonas sp. OV174 TaxID=1855300 RepID=UPI0008DF323C|nr:LysR substrate-binding domain-containing protein [Polaromonas sp. OV174]SFC31257.1 DNA-binding transcriptional regulator, LysR family [Polaromonas sp. OV174]